MFGIVKLLKRTFLGVTQGGLKRPARNQAMIRALIERAVTENLTIRIEYTDANGTHTIRRIEPLEWDNLNVKGRCLERLDFRIFRMQRIQSAAWTGDVFDPEDDGVVEKGKNQRRKAQPVTA